MTAILEAQGLVKHYPKVRAVDGVSFDVREGSCFGLLGPNGAGKTTTVEMLEGLLRPTAGEVRFRGAPLGADYRERLGIQFQATALQDFLTVRENLRFFGALYPRRVPMAELVAACRLEAFLDRDTHKLSGGQRQRVLLAIALVNDPELLFLDEPTTGLDPQARRNFWELVRGIRARGKTVVLTTHYMEEAYALCDEIAIMDHGRVIARGPPQRLLAQHFEDVVVELPAAALPERTWRFAVQRHGERVEIATADVNATVGELLAAGVSLAGLKVRPRTLEDLFLELTGKELRA
ncbi:MAG TPA: ABC transporter ATP-binding protein [Candidatus Binatia bacterium]|nr:ABC transporter ATP-binding protein [Candidatus Binatia bacterium]